MSTDWKPAETVLPTPWTHEVGPDNALPEYPRPRLVRERWLNLNGLWEYTTEHRRGERILVPYPPESALSGIGRHDDLMWYRRTFEIPGDWAGERVLLHFGAVDQCATVWVNHQLVAEHEGGYTEFSADITDALRADGPQEVLVRAEDRVDIGTFPLGKQRRAPGGILYTGASGIWQTVWLEPVPADHVRRLDVDSDLTGLTVTPRVSGGDRVEVVVSTPDGDEVARADGPAGRAIRVEVPSPRLWSPDDPYLYDLTVRLGDDVVRGYAGLRTIGVARDERGRPRIALNGRVTFLHGPLDQGYWPDGVYTAPTDDALRFDLEQTKELGFNFVRKHAKVEPARWYYWADKLGLLVWQDMPSLPVVLDNPPGPQAPPVPEAQRRFEAELLELIDQLRGVTSLVGWVPFNEGWGEYDTVRISALVREADPTRMVNASSGVNCCHSHHDTGAGDIYDDHTYVGPGRPEIIDARVTVDGEYGGLGLVVPEHTWPGPPMAYEMTGSPEELTRRYAEVSRELARLVPAVGLSGAIYTQTTDVENEVNGFFTYDRRTAKLDTAVAAAHNRKAIEAGSQPQDR
ncbi:glycoside hydrolase family 2 protein [Amycolatopsis sp. 195334CR]|uniref:glycoside hydrolase family 2 protein n=1 Tax=Amycolatopsis sp. 195334CR TaxID=2814588 RepID=UPI001A8ED6DE|nr:sugar-binding domain-containing protein [Amycolatopsis sp. 195334CR]MBN6033766.1 glycoside hydrolase family 2 [Amycolatopsis sp. 195334CR]